MKLAVGTAQFGRDYGIVNQRGQIPRGEAAKILAFAQQSGIDLIDTAPAYDESERTIGAALPENHSFRIITKSPTFRGAAAIDPSHMEELKETFYRSLERLRVARLYGLLLHNADALRVPGSLMLVDAMRDLVREGVVDKVGVSLYNGNQIDHTLSLFTPDIVQCPVNVFDQRLLASGHIAKLHRIGVEIHARSIFLQGLLLLPSANQLPPYFARWREHFARYFRHLADERLEQIVAALSFVAAQRGIAAAVVGVSCLHDLEQIVSGIGNLSFDTATLAQFSVSDPGLVDPSVWNHRSPGSDSTVAEAR